MTLANVRIIWVRILKKVQNIHDITSDYFVVVVEGQGGIFALAVGHIVGTSNYSRCDTKHRHPCTITPFY